MKNLILVISAIFLFLTVCKAQKPGELDSLLNILEGPFASDSLHDDAFRQLAQYHIHFSQGDEALSFLDSLEHFSKSANYGMGELFTHDAFVSFYFTRGNYDSVLVHIMEVITLAEKLDKPGWKAHALNKSANVYSIRGEHDTAWNALQQALVISEEIQDLDLLTMNLVSIGDLQVELGNYIEALQNFQTVDSIYEEDVEINHYRRGFALQNMGIIYLEKIGDLDKALSYMVQARAAYEEEGTDRGAWDSANKIIARIYAGMNRYQTADSLLLSALSGFRTRGQDRQVAETALILSGIKAKLGQTESAEALMIEAQQLYKPIGDKTGLRNAHSALGNFYAVQEAYKKSIDQYSLALSSESSGYNRVDLLKKLAALFRLDERPEEAYDTLLVLAELTDSLNKTRLSTNLREAEFDFQTSQKEKEIVALQLVQTQQELKNQKLIYASIFGITSLVFISFFFFYRARYRQKINQSLQAINELDSKLSTDISPEFRSPLSSIKDPVKMLIKKEEKPKNKPGLREVVDGNTQRLRQPDDSASDPGKVDAGKMTLMIRKVDFREHLKIIIASFESMAVTKGIEFKTNIAIPNSLFYYDPNHLETILFKLLNNAFKFTTVGHVAINAKIVGDEAVIAIVDTGIGLNEEHQLHIFNRNFHAKDNQSASIGKGIGLALVSELSKLHKGNLSVNSELGEGSTFTLSLPVNREVYERIDMDILSIYTPSTRKKELTSVHPMTLTYPYMKM